jgi:hypothetical protein
MTSSARLISPTRCRPRSRLATLNRFLAAIAEVRLLATCSGPAALRGATCVHYCYRDHLCRLCCSFHMGPEAAHNSEHNVNKQYLF